MTDMTHTLDALIALAAGDDGLPDDLRAGVERLRARVAAAGVSRQLTTEQPEGESVATVKAERDALQRENAELRERVRELEADAKRYRWLREECKNPSGGLTIAMVTEWELEGWSGDDPDNRIDAAMQEGKS